jgi:O-antigen/teichoic acid export membrane protein
MSKRSSRIIGALSSGLLLRIFGAVLNVLTVPIALRMLGQERYAAFATLLGFAGWLSIGSFGLGTVAAMSSAGLHENDETSRSLFWHATISACVVVGAVSIIALIPFELMSTKLVANASDDLRQELRHASYYCFIAFALCAVASPFEGRYVGLLRADYCNWVRLGWQTVAIGVLIIVAKFYNSILAVSVAVTIGPVGSALWFITKGVIDFPPPKSFAFDLRTSKLVLRQGAGFLASSLAVLFYGGGSLPLFAMAFGTEQLATAAVMARVIQMYFSLTAILLVPLSAALRHAVVEIDTTWVRAALFRSVGILLGTSIITALCLILFGQSLIARWTGTSLPMISEWLLPTGLLLVAISWSYLWVYACFATRGAAPVATLASMEVAIIASLYVALGKQIPAAWSLYIAAGVMLLISGTILPRLVLRHDSVQLSR